MITGMSVDLPAAAAFLASAGRVLDRRRFDLLTGAGPADAVVAAVDGYGNADGGYGWGLEPDLRSGSSQPGGALHALEAFADLAPATTPKAAEVCDWLAAVTLPDGGVPFALPVPDPAACAPFWAQADASSSSLQITAVVAATAHRVAAADPSVAAHPWLARSTAYCFDAVRALDASVHAMELAFTVQFLDAAGRAGGAAADEARALLDRLRPLVPADGSLHVAGGAADEFMRPLDFAPFPGGPARELFAPDVVEAELDHLAAGQQDDGGWTVDFDSYSPAAALEWRGHRTVNALVLLRANARL
jgi:hypothetical protein